MATSSPTTALITGASRGLGRSMALHLARRGVDIIGTFHSNADEAAKVGRLVEAEGRQARMLQLDVERSDTFAGFGESVKMALSEMGRERFDFLVNNAGVAGYASVMETTAEQLDRLFAIHLKAPFLLSQKLLPLMVDGGKVVNISSGLARFALPGSAAYGAMKGGVEVLTRYLAQELGARQITVNTIAPGAIATDFGGGVVRDNAHVNEVIAGQIALGRVGEPEDVGAAVAGLLTDCGSWINAQRIEVSGGQGL